MTNQPEQLVLAPSTAPTPQPWAAAINAFGINPDDVDRSKPVTITFPTTSDDDTVTLDCDLHYSATDMTRTVGARVTRQAVVVATALGLGAA